MEKYDIEQIAKYNAIAVFGMSELFGNRFTAADLLVYFDAMVADLKRGAMERSIQQFDEIVETFPKSKMN